MLVYFQTNYYKKHRKKNKFNIYLVSKKMNILLKQQENLKIFIKWVHL